MRSLTLATVAVLTMAGSAAAAETPASPGRGGTTVSLQAGLASGSMHDTSGALGGTLVHEFGSRWALEAAGAYLAESMGADSFTLSGGVLFHLRPTRERAAPYLALAGGLYRARFDMGDPVVRGGATHGYGGMVPGSMMGGGGMPHFYAQRMAAAWDPFAGPRRRTFTDPALSLGAGVRVDLGSRMFLRPDGRLLLAFSGGDNFTVGLMTVSFGWRF